MIEPEKIIRYDFKKCIGEIVTKKNVTSIVSKINKKLKDGKSIVIDYRFNVRAEMIDILITDNRYEFYLFQKNEEILFCFDETGYGNCKVKPKLSVIYDNENHIYIFTNNQTI